jgi:acetylornithine deacetylase/succinyl-diaminopimelate desuccinylase-like protein
VRIRCFTIAIALCCALTAAANVPPPDDATRRLAHDIYQQLVEINTTEYWDVPVIPTMASGASDGLYLRNAGVPTYGISGLFSEVGDNRAHGRDERVAVGSFYDSLQFLYTLVKRMAS